MDMVCHAFSKMGHVQVINVSFPIIRRMTVAEAPRAVLVCAPLLETWCRTPE